MKKLRVAYIGLAHIHVITLGAEFHRYPELFELVGAADYFPESEEQRQRHIKLNVPDYLKDKIWDDYKELLKQDIDIAVITTDIADHAAACEETLAMNIHTVVEKPMAMTMADAKRMYRAHCRSSAELIINWPVAWFPAFNLAKDLTDRGIVGKVLRVQYRSPSTRGPYKLGEYTAEELSKLWWYKADRGGGSISDYAGYGCALTTWFTGKTAKRVSGMKKNFFLNFSDVEDYSVFCIDFGDSVGLIEGSWSTMSNGQIPTGPIVYGTEGVIVADRYDKEIKVYKELKPYVTSPGPDEVHLAEDTGDALAMNIWNFLHDGKPLHQMITAEFNMKIMAAFDAGRRSCESGVTEYTYEPFQS